MAAPGHSTWRKAIEQQQQQQYSSFSPYPHDIRICLNIFDFKEKQKRMKKWRFCLGLLIE